jgi:hypothetical protein
MFELKVRQFVGEIDSPGYMEELVSRPRRPDSIRSDSSLQTVDLDESGKKANKRQGRPFNVEKDRSSNPRPPAQVAQVLNWMLKSFSKGPLPASLFPCQPDDFERYRSKRMPHVIQARERLVDRLLAQGVIGKRVMEEDRALNTPASSSQSTNGSARR